MTRASSPTVRRRELAARLRELRLAGGLTIEDVAGRLLVSSTKISRLETAARPASLRDVKDLCELYAVSEQERNRLMDLARDSRQRSWWQQYDLSEVMATYIGIEIEAVTILQYETSLVPPLLQTEAYARAVTAGASFGVPSEQIDSWVQARLKRQDLLSGNQPPDLRTIVDEGALHRLVGGPATMRAQLETLADRSRLPHVNIQVIPLEVGAHPGMDSAFTILQLPDSAVPDVVYVEGLLGRFFLQSPSDLARYRRAFDLLRDIALSPRESERRIAAIAADLPAKS